MGRSGLTESFAGKVRKHMQSVDVREFVKSKNGQTYLPWPPAWRILVDAYPGSRDEYRLDVLADETCIVVCRLTIVGDGCELVHTERRAIERTVKGRKGAVPAVRPTSVEVCNAEKRTLVKAISRATGLAFFIYAKEDPGIESDHHVQADSGSPPPPQDDDAQESGKLIQRMREQKEILAGNIPEEAKKLAHGSLQDKRRAVAILDAVIGQDLNQTHRRNGKPWEAYGGAS